jgi:hypothetical protein
MVYCLQGDEDRPGLTITWRDGRQQYQPEFSLSAEASAFLFQRSEEISQITLVLPTDLLFTDRVYD